MALTGNFSETPFADLVQFYAASRQSVALTVMLPGGQAVDGVFYLEDGDIVDGFLGEAVGGEAVRRPMLLAEGSFRIEPGIRAAERTITESLEHLLAAGPQQGLERGPSAGRELPTRARSADPAAGRAGRPGGEQDVRAVLAGGGTQAGPAPGGSRGQPRATAEGTTPRGLPTRPRRTRTRLVAAVAILILAAAAAVYLRCRSHSALRGPRSALTLGNGRRPLPAS